MKFEYTPDEIKQALVIYNELFLTCDLLTIDDIGAIGIYEKENVDYVTIITKEHYGQNISFPLNLLYTDDPVKSIQQYLAEQERLRKEAEELKRAETIKRFDWEKFHNELEDTLKNMTPQDWQMWEIYRKLGEKQYNEAQSTKTQK